MLFCYLRFSLPTTGINFYINEDKNIKNGRSTFQEDSNLYLNQEAQVFKETAKWALFLSILGFVGVGFMVILALFIGTIFRP
jgi:hypothetical protein